ncbi:MAG: 50S ribosomal protein L24 [Candidatus Latescibacteria bacterium]|nr:50S ribosomal protein L24 [Candidatus Latescibacterota bacterium]
MHVRKGDTVMVIAGDDRGKTGRVLKLIPDKRRLIVEGINFIIRHTRPSQINPQGGRVEKEAPIHISNVMVVCPRCNQGTRVERRLMDDRKRARVCKRCGEVIPAA